MIDLVCIYCLIANASSCIEKRVPLEDFNSPVACVNAGEQRAQEFVHDHPNYRLTSWRCEVDVPKQVPT